MPLALLRSSAILLDGALRSRANNTQKFLPFEEARSFARSLGFSNWADWCRWRQSGERPANIPANPASFYRGKFLGSADWLAYKPRSRKRSQCVSFSKSQKAYANILKGETTKEKFKNHVLAQAQDIELRRLRGGQQASFLFRVKCENEEPTPKEREWLPLQLKMGVSRPRCSNKERFQISSLPKVPGIAVIAVVDGDRFRAFSDEDPLLRKAKSRWLQFDSTRCRPLDDIVPTLREWWSLGKPQLETDLLFNLVSRPNDILIETLNKQLRCQYYEKCGFEIESIANSNPGAQANFLLGGKFRLLQNIGSHGPDCRGVFAKRNSSSKHNGTVEGKDAFDFYVVLVRDDFQLTGFFFFPRDILLENGYTRSTSTSMFYPPYVVTSQKKAKRAQEWQAKYFVSNVEEFKALGKELGILQLSP